MNESPISWLAGPDGRQGSTWNPTDGCEVCSPGCKNCYAMRMAGRFSGPGKPYEGLVTFGKNGKAVWNGTGRLNRKSLLRPLHWHRGRSVFVDSMSDLFFEPITDDEIAACFGVMAAAPQHRYMILTKRGSRMREWYRTIADRGAHRALRRCGDNAERHGAPVYVKRKKTGRSPWNDAHAAWPLPHLWQGVSVDTRKHGLPRIDELRDIDAAVRWLSIEPLLEDLGELDLRGIHWVVVGCESGPGARACKPEWIMSIVEQCKAAGVPVYVKQAEESTDCGLDRLLEATDDDSIAFGDGSELRGRAGKGNRIVERPYLYGQQYLEFPCFKS